MASISYRCKRTGEDVGETAEVDCLVLCDVCYKMAMAVIQASHARYEVALAHLTKCEQGDSS